MKFDDKVTKASWELHESGKDAVRSNIVQAVNSGQIKVESSALPTLLALIDASLDEGYHRGVRTFVKTVAAAADKKD